MNQVRENRFLEVLNGIKMAFTALAVNDGITPSNLDKEVEAIRKQENTEAIEKLEKATTSVNIPLKDMGVERVHVNEEEAQKQADQVKKTKKRADKQKQIGE